MSEQVKIVDLSEVLAGLDAFDATLNSSLMAAVDEMALMTESQVKTNLNTRQNQYGKGHEGSPGDFPNRRTGNLSNSVKTETREGFGTYTAEVGPSAIYALQLEQGWESGVNYPYMKPSVDQVEPMFMGIILSHVESLRG